MELASAIGRPRAATRIDERDRRAADAGPASAPSDVAPRDRVTLSPEAQEQGGSGDASRDERRARARGATGARLTAEQQRQVIDLQQRDTHVRQHEAAHQAAGGSLTGGASFTYQVGPDGRSYAVGGEVPVRLAQGRTPDETISNARQARRAALAPTDPSSADLSVAAAATQMELAAVQRRAKLASKAYGKQRNEEPGRGGPEAGRTPGVNGYEPGGDAAPAERTIAA